MRRPQWLEDADQRRTAGLGSDCAFGSSAPVLLLDISVRRKSTPRKLFLTISNLADLKGLIYRQDAEFEIERIYIKSSRLFHDKLVWCVDVVDEIFHVSDLMAGRLGVVYLTESQQCIFSEPGDWGAVVNIEKTVYSSNIRRLSNPLGRRR